MDLSKAPAVELDIAGAWVLTHLTRKTAFFAWSRSTPRSLASPPSIQAVRLTGSIPTSLFPLAGCDMWHHK